MRYSKLMDNLNFKNTRARFKTYFLYKFVTFCYFEQIKLLRNSIFEQKWTTVCVALTTLQPYDSTLFNHQMTIDGSTIISLKSKDRFLLLDSRHSNIHHGMGGTLTLTLWYVYSLLSASWSARQNSYARSLLTLLSTKLPIIFQTRTKPLLEASCDSLRSTSSQLQNSTCSNPPV